MIHSNKLSLPVLLLVLAAPTMALAQTAKEDKTPNVLLIVDTSGSMEYVTDSNTFPDCALDEKSRWIEVLEVLTGTIDGYGCASIDRSSSGFIEEYSKPLDGNAPPDTNYRNPYHRPLSNGCARSPDLTLAADTVTMPTLTNAFQFTGTEDSPFSVGDNRTIPGSCSFSQTGEPGFIDIYDTRARFGLMTFDTLPDPNVGYTGAGFTPQPPLGIRGAWSYFGSASAASGKPADCDDAQPMEVGVRSGAAPISEGKMIYFGGEDLDEDDNTDRHLRIQDVLLTTRPFGATPINGALDDARHFFRVDTSNEPSGDSLYSAGQNLVYSTVPKLSPRYDGYVECGCRDQYIILITDGEPNLDMRPDCEALGTGGEGSKGDCPYKDKPTTILTALAGGSTEAQSCASSGDPKNNYRIPTYVVGFATDTYGDNKSCALLTKSADIPDWGAFCEANQEESPSFDAELKVCCTLHELAAAGDTGTPYIAPTAEILKLALGDIMKSVGSKSASGTRPVRSPGVGLSEPLGGSVAFRLLTSFETDAGTSGLWRGNIERLRWECKDGVATEMDKEDGDDFSFNVAKNKEDREFITFIPEAEDESGLIHSGRSVRPWLASNVTDGLGSRGGVQKNGAGPAFVSSISAESLTAAMNVTSSDKCTGADTAQACAQQILSWTIGYSAGGLDRCANSGDAANCSVIGDVIHSTPVIVDRPKTAVEDESYKTFAEGPAKERPMIALISSNDGFLHGFNLSPNVSTDGGGEAVKDSSENNEYFAFLPPAVLLKIEGQYPKTHMDLLDGTAIVEDVVAVEVENDYGYLLERSTASAATLSNTWRTIMVQAFGGKQPGYFAVDITDPARPSKAKEGGVKFLWQVTTTDAPAALFGTGGTPLITTVNMQEESAEGDTSYKEVAVAVLPGGGGSRADETCTRRGASVDAKTGWNGSLTGHGSSDYEPRSYIPCYSGTGLAARSLTIVRLDSGEIIRTFRQYSGTDPEIPGLTSDALLGDPETRALDSPITGIPAAFPAGAGMVADRVFVGDRDGGLWRVDLSSPNPEEWSMDLFFDAYAEDPNLGSAFVHPITTAPILSVDTRGQITINFATGSLSEKGVDDDINYVYSLTEAEHPSEASYYAKVNWKLRLEKGKHVIGPLSLLDGVLYFSTIDPSLSDSCNPAQSSIWGVDYLDAEPPPISNEGEEVDPSAAEPIYGGKARLALDPESDAFDADHPVEQERSVASLTSTGDDSAVYGLSLEFVPSCSSASETIPGTLIDGSRSAVSTPSSSKLQLVFQNTSGAPSSKFSTNFETVALAPPKTASSILSWAAILE